ncbi:hypothetical protein DFH29DRAFT_877733 [Suillus ampliporus]|nr:hypothetical protein DFH29DRAFT_877733 [Suillus ampliporus]
MARNWLQVHCHHLWWFHLFLGTYHQSGAQGCCRINGRDYALEFSKYATFATTKFAVSKSVNCMDLSVSDRFFDAIIQNAFIPLQRNRHVWRSCIMPVPSDLGRVPVHTFNHEEFYSSSRSYSPPLSDVEEDKVQHIVIKTSYNLLSPENQRFKAPRNKADNSIWSATERSHAEAGEQVRSIEGLKMKLAKLYHNGVKIMQDVYLRIPMHIIPKHCTLGHEAPTDVQPWALEKEGMCTNHSQLYEELFEWVRKLMETYLQEEFELLMEVTAVLPGNCSPPIAPFPIETARITIYVLSFPLVILKVGPCAYWRMDLSLSCGLEMWLSLDPVR